MAYSLLLSTVIEAYFWYKEKYTTVTSVWLTEFLSFVFKDGTFCSFFPLAQRLNLRWILNTKKWLENLLIQS